jgi:hypothetical protein
MITTSLPAGGLAASAKLERAPKTSDNYLIGGCKGGASHFGPMGHLPFRDIILRWADRDGNGEIAGVSCVRVKNDLHPPGP